MSKLINPIISEKANTLSSGGAYTFRVEKGANKLEIKKSVEDLFKVNVRKVNLVTIPPKKRIVRGKVGFKSGYKKAIVYLKKGQKIDLA
ncbi:MAG: 50S ribosomal protein L23 [Candidatus Giovannonibacteria bacterium GW2011_GWB1_45_9b]|uniref:Large ribosomal subunit protein uL23 n=7 Tax=Candidatus Giovannoniibacteriota TaxID=1752738 RepID=A0A1F5X168_9BACT|nr:MAG: 50S ribosomal protein L23 [Candidatus Giovannonibacteria bacterium GW2011_GWC2_44_8]KKU05200.1 MAG: 50S ribosomal protein L23 [Candidatus Giovannonibacteria bacterium GW2011_GWA2_45_21]KKU16730.1 MAG: 50S ribosomal protein L23 [Candidatus Giovannonibacteria bacterium GW2011_GWB1_45_9b]OGF73787.1 MAG: 50S ribosomal protein L23 [Candidatus Giovannonibacteria bacterium RIFCSPHIGHO2_02_43_16]OGF81644.1 MAG: 50S ribosomal protein L23 [Candidatus Giovannonibacteria bacterium RIFCSPHIGHO2_12_4